LEIWLEGLMNVNVRMMTVVFFRKPRSLAMDITIG
jgi:hypothetical protein